MYYNRILRLWVVDPLDYFLISALIGSIVASYLKKYLSEQEAIKRLKKSMINKSSLIKGKKKMFKSKDLQIKKIYKFALDHRGGQFEEFKTNHEFSNEIFKMAQEIEKIVVLLAAFLKKKEMQGILKIFFSRGRLILELILYRCSITISYLVLNKGVNTQVVVLTSTVGGAAGFTIGWFTGGAVLVTPPLLLSTLLLRSFTQQIFHHIEYVKFKKMINQMLEDDEVKKTLKAFFVEGEGSVSSSRKIQMRPLDLDQNGTLKHDFTLKSTEKLDELIKEKIKNEFSLIENPTQVELKKIIQKTQKPKGKTVYFRDFIKKISDYDVDISNSDIIDAEIIEKTIRLKADNQL